MDFFLSRVWTADVSAPPLQTPDGLRLHVPHTITYEVGRATAWYFTAADGKLKRKHSSRCLDKDLIIKTLGRRTRSSSSADQLCKTGVVAVFIPSNGNPRRYFDKKDLTLFVKTLCRGATGVLQKYVPSRGPHAIAYEVTFARDAGLRQVLRGTNAHDPCDPKLPISQRLGVFDLPESVGGVFFEDLPPDSYIGAAVEHLVYVLAGRIQHIALEKTEFPAPEEEDFVVPVSPRSELPSYTSYGEPHLPVGSGIPTSHGPSMRSRPTSPRFAHMLRTRIEFMVVVLVMGVDGKVYLDGCSDLVFSNAPQLGYNGEGSSAGGSHPPSRQRSWTPRVPSPIYAGDALAVQHLPPSRSPRHSFLSSGSSDAARKSPSPRSRSPRSPRSPISARSPRPRSSRSTDVHAGDATVAAYLSDFVALASDGMPESRHHNSRRTSGGRSPRRGASPSSRGFRPRSAARPVSGGSGVCFVHVSHVDDTVTHAPSGRVDRWVRPPSRGSPRHKEDAVRSEIWALPAIPSPERDPSRNGSSHRARHAASNAMGAPSSLPPRPSGPQASSAGTGTGTGTGTSRTGRSATSSVIAVPQPFLWQPDPSSSSRAAVGAAAASLEAASRSEPFVQVQAVHAGEPPRAPQSASPVVPPLSSQVLFHPCLGGGGSTASVDAGSHDARAMPSGSQSARARPRVSATPPLHRPAAPTTASRRPGRPAPGRTHHKAEPHL